MADVMSELALLELLSLECRVDDTGTLRYYSAQGQIHRVHGPAAIYRDGTDVWYQNGQCHRADGPALIHAGGHRAWYQNGRLHRLDGPAVKYADGHRSWYINGKRHTKSEWQHAVDSMGVV